jgi:hypothetical protein
VVEVLEKLSVIYETKSLIWTFVKYIKVMETKNNDAAKKRFGDWRTKLEADIAALDSIIANNSRYWTDTTEDSEKNIRHGYNNILRQQKEYDVSKLKLINILLSGL